MVIQDSFIHTIYHANERDLVRQAAQNVWHLYALFYLLAPLRDFYFSSYHFHMLYFSLNNICLFINTFIMVTNLHTVVISYLQASSFTPSWILSISSWYIDHYIILSDMVVLSLSVFLAKGWTHSERWWRTCPAYCCDEILGGENRLVQGRRRKLQHGARRRPAS